MTILKVNKWLHMSLFGTLDNFGRSFYTKNEPKLNRKSSKRISKSRRTKRIISKKSQHKNRGK